MRRSFAPSQLLQPKRPRVNYREYEEGSDSENSQRDSLGLLSPQARTAHDELIQQILAKPFKVPITGYEMSGVGKLGMTREQIKGALHSPDDENALVLSTPPEEYLQKYALNPPKDKKEIKVHVVVDPILCKVLRPHQREGVKFMYDCITGAKIDGAYGCIMADDMGLGKTLQCITLLWTVLKQGPDTNPIVENAIIVCPSSLVKNWYAEIGKWLGKRVNPLAMDGGSKQEIETQLREFINPNPRLKKTQAYNPILIISYDTFRLYAHILTTKPVGMVLCDEGHRLKNAKNLTFQALDQLQTKKRVLLSGTPIQNDLTEYFCLLNFVNSGILGTVSEFRRKYETPILRARDSLASDKEITDGTEKLNELLTLANKFTIRRTQELLSKYLPVKLDFVVFCRMTPTQERIYKHFLNSKAAKKAASSNGAGSLSGITTLKKIVTHPSLVFDKILKGEDGLDGLEDVIPDDFSRKSYRSNVLNASLGGKFVVLDTMLAHLRATTTDKIILVSNYTQTLDLFIDLCRMRNYGYIRLDGSKSIPTRMKLVNQFNDPSGSEFVFLLSSKAGGCGLNLIGANRLILFDPDWNPANDEQAMARVWRDGQRKKCFIYRFVTTGTIEEKIFQRQAHKQALSSCVVDEEQDVERHFTAEFLQDLFTYKEGTVSDTHDSFKCKKCTGKIVRKYGEVLSVGNSDDMAQWDHFSDSTLLPDEILKKSAGNIVSFVFANQSHEKQMGLVTPTSQPASGGVVLDSNIALKRARGDDDDDEWKEDDESDEDWGDSKGKKKQSTTTKSTKPTPSRSTRTLRGK